MNITKTFYFNIFTILRQLIALISIILTGNNFFPINDHIYLIH